jgi:hypothetical protein
MVRTLKLTDGLFSVVALSQNMNVIALNIIVVGVFRNSKM